MYMLKVVFLGTGSMMPTKRRNHVATLLSYKTDNILIDCGEGTQRQFRIAKINPTNITKILITHWHGDHVLGLPGLLQTLEKNNYNKTLEIYGPKGTKNYFKNMFKWFACGLKIKCKIIEVNSKFVFKNDDYKIEAIKLDHNIHCLGYSFIEKDKRKIDMDYVQKFGLKSDPILRKLQNGKDIKYNGKIIKASKATSIKKGMKVSLITDTKYNTKIINFVKGSDLLICEATFGDDLKKKADEYKHLTSKLAATIASKAKVKKLILNHFSQRYKESKDILSEAKSVFDNALAASDFMAIEI